MKTCKVHTNELIKLINTTFKVNFIIDDSLMNSKLTSAPFSFDAVRMYQLLMCIEEEFNICFTSQEIAQGDFRSLSAIQNTVEKKLDSQ